MFSVLLASKPLFKYNLVNKSELYGYATCVPYTTVKTSSEITKLLKMKSGDGENAPEVDFFLLSDVCAEDKELRMHLQLSKLEHVLAVQEKERNNVEFKRACFFCRMEFEGSHSKLLDHMAFDHNFRFVMLKMHLPYFLI